MRAYGIYVHAQTSTQTTDTDSNADTDADAETHTQRLFLLSRSSRHAFSVNRPRDLCPGHSRRSSRKLLAFSTSLDYYYYYSSSSSYYYCYYYYHNYNHDSTNHYDIIVIIIIIIIIIIIPWVSGGGAGRGGDELQGQVARLWLVISPSSDRTIGMPCRAVLVETQGMALLTGIQQSTKVD